MHAKKLSRTFVKHASAFAFALSLGACDSTVTESDLQKWTNNEVGFEKVTTVIQDPKQPMPIRVRALEVVIEKGHEIRVRGMIDPIADEADRLAVARQLVDHLMKHVQTRSPSQLQAKDAAMTLMRFLPPEQLDALRKVVAEWAFSDITWETPPADIKQKLESRISAGQIADLGAYGYESAAILLANGFVADQMVRYLSAAKTPEAGALFIKAMRRYLPAYGPNPFYLDTLRKTEDPAAAVMLLELYLNKGLEQEARDACFATAIMMLESAKIKDDAAAKKLVVDELMKVAKDGDAEDLWLVSANVLGLTGTSRLAEFLANVDPELKYREADEDAAKSTLDLCFDLEAMQKPAEIEPVLRRQLASGNPVQKAIALLCAKTMRLEGLRPELTALAAALDKPEDISAAALLGEVERGDPPKQTPITLGFLAQNALEGLQLLATAEADAKAGKITEDQLKARRFMIVVEFELLGEEYTKAIDERFQTWLAEQAKPAPKQP